MYDRMKEEEVYADYVSGKSRALQLADLWSHDLLSEVLAAIEASAIQRLVKV